MADPLPPTPQMNKLAKAPLGWINAAQDTIISRTGADGQTLRIEAKPGDAVYSADQLQTGSAGNFHIRMRDGSRLDAGPNSIISPELFTDNPSWTPPEIKSRPPGKRETRPVRTPSAILGVRG